MSPDLIGLKGFYIYILSSRLTLHNNKKMQMNQQTNKTNIKTPKYPQDPPFIPRLQVLPELNSLLVATAAWCLKYIHNITRIPFDK